MPEGTDHAYCAMCGYPAIGWATPQCPECGSSHKTRPNPGRAICRALIWLVVCFIVFTIILSMWFAPFELQLIRAIEFPYDRENQRYTPERGFVVLRDAQGRFPFYNGLLGLDNYDKLDEDPDWLRGMRVAIYDRQFNAQTPTPQVIQIASSLNTLNYDHAKGLASYTDNGNAVTGPLDEAFTRQWLNVAYPGLEPELTAVYAKAIPQACEPSSLQTAPLQYEKMRTTLQAIDPLFYGQSDSTGRGYRNDNPSRSGSPSGTPS